MPSLRVAACALSVVAAAAVGGFSLRVSASQPETNAPISHELATIYDTPAHAEPPLYCQTDERWGGLPYATADSTVAESGCGLCCAAMAASYITGEDITPPVLLNLVGNRCIDAGQNHMGRFCEELSALYGIE